MSRSKHVLVTGAGGDIGSAIVQNFVSSGATVTAVDIKSESEILNRYSKEQQSSIKAVCLDLCDQKAVQDFFKETKPEEVYLAAAKVGGVHANNTYPAEFIYENLIVQANVTHQAVLSGVKKLIPIPIVIPRIREIIFLVFQSPKLLPI